MQSRRFSLLVHSDKAELLLGYTINSKPCPTSAVPRGTGAAMKTFYRPRVLSPQLSIPNIGPTISSSIEFRRRPQWAFTHRRNEGIPNLLRTWRRFRHRDHGAHPFDQILSSIRSTLETRRSCFKYSESHHPIIGNQGDAGDRGYTFHDRHST